MSKYYNYIDIINSLSIINIIIFVNDISIVSLYCVFPLAFAFSFPLKYILYINIYCHIQRKY